MHNYYSSMTISNKDEKYTTQTKEKKWNLKYIWVKIFGIVMDSHVFVCNGVVCTNFKLT